MEKLIIKFKLPQILSFTFISALVAWGYNKTGNKFWVTFNGSKGYLSHITISCEGVQNEEGTNRIWIERLRNKNGSLKSKMVQIFHSEENGIRISI